MNRKTKSNRARALEAAVIALAVAVLLPLTGATAFAQCYTAPTFSGVANVSNPGGSTCNLEVSWNAASSPCGGTISYNIYRGTSSGFTPSADNRIAFNVSGLIYLDNADIVQGTRYYYVVRAMSDANWIEETNATQASGLAGGIQLQTAFYDDLDANRIASADLYWVRGVFAGDNDGAGDIYKRTNCGAKSPVTVWRFGHHAQCNKYSSKEESALVFGGDGTSDASINGFLLPADAYDIELTFWHRYQMVQNSDGGRLMYSTTSAYTGYLPVPDTPQAGKPYIQSGGYTGMLADGVTEAWTGDYLAAGFTQVTVNFDELAGQRVWLVWRFSTGNNNNNWYGYALDDVRFQWQYPSGSCSTAPSPLRVFTARGGSDAFGAGTNKLEWAAAPGSSVEIHWSASAPPANPDPATWLATVATDATGYGSTTHGGLAIGSSNHYSAFAVNGGLYSKVRSVSSSPVDSTGVKKWTYKTGAAALNPPALNGAAYAASNDRFLHAMKLTATGGDWPVATSWKPFAMNGPSQARTPVLGVGSYPIGGATRVGFVSSMDGRVYAFNADTGEQIWQSAVLGDVILSAPSGIFRQYGSTLTKDILLVGTRNSSAPNRLVALDASNGATLWSFDNGGSSNAANAIGVINGSVMIDTVARRLWFASRARSGGSSNTLWCLDFSEIGASLLWYAAAGDIDASPVARNGVVYVGTTGGTVAAYSGTGFGAAFPIWQHATGDGAIKSMVLPEWGTGYLFFSTNTKVWATIDNGGSYSVVWSSTSAPSPTRPLYMRSTAKIYVGANDGNIYVFSNVKTATPAVSTIQVSSSPIVIGAPLMDFQNSVIHVGDESGMIYAIQP